jgi:hypothetical protein
MSPLDDLRALVVARRYLDEEIKRLTEQAVTENVSRSELAYLLGISRATLYRRYSLTDGTGTP